MRFIVMSYIWWHFWMSGVRTRERRCCIYGLGGADPVQDKKWAASTAISCSTNGLTTLFTVTTQNCCKYSVPVKIKTKYYWCWKQTSLPQSVNEQLHKMDMDIIHKQVRLFIIEIVMWCINFMLTSVCNYQQKEKIMPSICWSYLIDEWMNKYKIHT